MTMTKQTERHAKLWLSVSCPLTALFFSFPSFIFFVLGLISITTQVANTSAVTIQVFKHCFSSTVQIYDLSYIDLKSRTKQKLRFPQMADFANKLIHKPQRLWDSGKHFYCELHINNGLTYDYFIRAKRLGIRHVNYRSEDLLTIPCFFRSCQTPVSNDAQEAWVFQSYDLVTLAPTENEKKNGFSVSFHCYLHSLCIVWL